MEPGSSIAPPLNRHETALTIKIIPRRNHMKIFGLSEFVSLFTVFILAWTLSDYESKTRLKLSKIRDVRRMTNFIAVLFFLVSVSDFLEAAGLKIAGNHYWRLLLGALSIAACLIFLYYAFSHKPKLSNANIKILSAEFDLANYSNDSSKINVLLVFLLEWLDDFHEIKKSASWIVREEEIDKGHVSNMFLILSAGFTSNHIATCESNFLRKFFALGLHSKPIIPSLGLFVDNILTVAINDESSFLYRESGGELSYSTIYKPITADILSPAALHAGFGLCSVFSRKFIINKEKLKLLTSLINHQLSLATSLNSSRDFSAFVQKIYHDIDQINLTLTQYVSNIENYADAANFLRIYFGIVSEVNYRIDSNMDKPVAAKASLAPVLKILAFNASEVALLMMKFTLAESALDKNGYSTLDFFRLKSNSRLGRQFIVEIVKRIRFLRVNERSMIDVKNLSALDDFIAAVDSHSDLRLIKTILRSAI